MCRSVVITMVIAQSTTDPNGKMHTNDYLQVRAGAKNRKYKVDYAAVGTTFAPAIVSVAGHIHPEFLRLQWVLADKQTRNYYALIGAEREKILL